jgi:hypothetical protein
MAPSLAMIGAFPVKALNTMPSAAYWVVITVPTGNSLKVKMASPATAGAETTEAASGTAAPLEVGVANTGAETATTDTNAAIEPIFTQFTMVCSSSRVSRIVEGPSRSPVTVNAHFRTLEASMFRANRGKLTISMGSENQIDQGVKLFDSALIPF